MNITIVFIIGLVDYLLDSLQVTEADFIETRSALLTTISARFSLNLSQNPLVARELNIVAAQLKPGTSLAQTVEAISAHFKNINMSEVRAEILLKETAVEVMAEFTQKTAQDPAKLMTMVQRVLG